MKKKPFSAAVCGAECECRAQRRAVGRAIGLAERVADGCAQCHADGAAERRAIGRADGAADRLLGVQYAEPGDLVFFSISRSMPTVNSEGLCRSEGAQRRGSPETVPTATLPILNLSPSAVRRRHMPKS